MFLLFPQKRSTAAALMMFLALSGCAESGGDSASSGPAVAPPLAPPAVATERAVPEIYDCATKAEISIREHRLALATLAEGTFAASALSPSFETPGANVFRNSFFGDSKYFAAQDAKNFSLKSKSCSRDQEVSTWTKISLVFLRMTDAGDGIYIETNVNANSIEIGLVTGAKEGAGFRAEPASGTFYPLWSSNDLSSLATNFDPDGGVFTYGAQAFDIYVKYNDLDLVRIQDFRPVASGRIALQSVAGYGFRDVIVRHPQKQVLFSRLEARQYDLRDFGMKSLRATAGLSLNSTQAVLTSNPGFAVGDSVIVETGSEPGAGARGTIGVGGAWPMLAYPSTSAMVADTTQPTGTFAGVSGTTDVYLWTAGQWVRQSSYYVSKSIPLALRAKVLAVSADRLTLTLDVSARQAANGAQIYSDNGPILNSILSSRPPGPIPSGVTIQIPGGDFAVGLPLKLQYRNGWTIAGMGRTRTRLYSPKGAPSFNLTGYQVNDTVVRDLSLEGNLGDDGFGFGELSLQPAALTFLAGQHNGLQDVDAKNTWGQAFQASYETNTSATRAHYEQTAPLQAPTQAAFAWLDSSSGGCTDCLVTSVFATQGFAAVRSSDVQLLRPHAVNAAVVLDASGGFLVQDAYLSFTPMSQALNSDQTFDHFMPIVNLTNASASGGGFASRGGTLRNVVMIQQGYFNDRSDLLSGIAIDRANPNVRIEGGYFKSFAPPVSTSLVGAAAVNASGANLVIDGLIVASEANLNAAPFANIAVASGTISNCVANVINAPNALITNCKTMSQASPGLLTPPAAP